MTCYKIPLDAKAMMQPSKYPKISESLSVRRHIYLILMTHWNAYKYDPKYGCMLWMHDFDISKTESDWTSEIAQSLTTTLTTHEPRLADGFKVKANIVRKDNDDLTDINQEFTIRVYDMVLKETNEAIDEVNYTIVFSPITIK